MLAHLLHLPELASCPWHGGAVSPGRQRDRKGELNRLIGVRLEARSSREASPAGSGLRKWRQQVKGRGRENQRSREFWCRRMMRWGR